MKANIFFVTCSIARSLAFLHSGTWGHRFVTKNTCTFAVRVLYDAGGLTSSDEEAEVTELGRVGVHMPVDLSLVKLILLGRAFGCVNDAIIMAAALSLQVGVCFL